MSRSSYTTLFLDIGGVLLTNGWDRNSRALAARQFAFDLDEMNKRHALFFDTYEIGKITLDTYLDYVVFYTPRKFSREEFKKFLFSQSQMLPEMFHWMIECKERFGLTVIAVTNEGRELMENRIHLFQLKKLFDFFICSSFLGIRKPDADIYRRALDAAYVSPEEVIYVDDRELMTDIAKSLGMQTIHHVSFEDTKKQLLHFLKD
jgi:putative hydrolase of the HAD superfamily